MDGTLLCDDKTVAASDAEAIRAAALRGVAVTLATGRLATGTLPVARALDLGTPLICADGGLLVDVATGATLDRRVIAPDVAADAIEALEAHGLVPFVFLADAIHCDENGAQHRSYIDTWSQELVVHSSLLDADAWRRADGVAMTVGLGAASGTERAYDHLRRAHGDTLDTVYFRMGPAGPAGGPVLWVVRSLPRGCDKGEMLGRLAARLGLGRGEVAAVGDWYNDLGMFAYSGRSFAMGQAPDAVRSAATDRLRSSSATGGGVAEALAALLGGTPPLG
jgi:hydroxymethylpyrimidine pyrophosphatase-like HAD family hydrolase